MLPFASAAMQRLSFPALRQHCCRLQGFLPAEPALKTAPSACSGADGQCLVIQSILYLFMKLCINQLICTGRIVPCLTTKCVGFREYPAESSGGLDMVKSMLGHQIMFECEMERRHGGKCTRRSWDDGGLVSSRWCMRAS